MTSIQMTRMYPVRFGLGLCVMTICLMAADQPEQSVQTNNMSAIPQLVPPYIKPNPYDFSDITAGGYHTCAIRNNGNVYCWGLNDTGQAGVWSTTPLCNNQKTNCVLKPTFVTTTAQIDAGADHTCALSNYGEASCWGNGSFGQLGSINFGYQSQPAPVMGNHIFTSISSGTQSTCGNAADGVYCWGAIVDSVHGSNPVQMITTFGQSTVTSISVGHLHVCVLAFPGSAHTPICLGNDQFGQLGVEPIANSLQYTGYTGSTLGYSVSRLSTQYNFTCVDQASGVVQCVGADDVGQLGNGQTIWNGTFQAQSVGNGMPLHGVTAGFDHACALDPGGNAYCWGNGLKGQLGNSAAANFNTPQAVSGGLAFRKVAAGTLHTCGITIDNQIYCWGNNFYGQLGAGYQQDYSIWYPVRASDPN